MSQSASMKGTSVGQNLGIRGVERPDVEGEDLAETWFYLENSTEQARALTRLEGELSTTLLFEHGGRQTVIPLWVVYILLGYLFRERLALGQMVESFAKHYWREAMRSLVKLQDLVDLVEPPLGGTPAMKTSRQTKEEAMELDDEEEEQEEDTLGGQRSLREANLGLG